ncbi:cytidylate kinase family protein [Candidatus Marsarchaeota archaeon]|nr:cytidylate kinase family protein [Candidatus Marsarchaeota archaeon]
MMKICISGFTASGKTTVADLVSKKLGIPHIHKSYKEYVKSELEIAKFTENATEDFVKGFDNEIVRLASEQESCVLSTWLAPWMVRDATLRVWLNADHKLRAERWSKAYKTSQAEAEKLVYEKDQSEIDSIKKIYGIDLNDRSIFDLTINTGLIGASEASEIICLAAKASERR